VDQPLHMTHRRKLVYEALRAADDHPTAADIMERLREGGQRLAYATVYNALRYLTDAGVIQELQVGQGAARYDARMEEHQHVVCTQCGRIEEVLGLGNSAYMEAVRQQTGYQVSRLRLIAEGLCPECASKIPAHPQ
jgi:Fur family peroxide stress response transcriptional regulator